MLHCNMTLYEAEPENCQVKIVRCTMNGCKFMVIALTKSKCLRRHRDSHSESACCAGMTPLTGSEQMPNDALDFEEYVRC
jgi:hypothetical protein